MNKKDFVKKNRRIITRKRAKSACVCRKGVK
jgi:hypothetical protein